MGLPDKAAVCRVDAVEVAAFGPEIDSAVLQRDARLNRSYRHFVDQRAVSEVQTIQVAIFAAEIKPIAIQNGRAVHFEARFVVPDNSAIPGVKTIDMMIQTAGHNPVTENSRRRLKTVLPLERP